MKAEDIRSGVAPDPLRSRPVRALTQALRGLTGWLPARYGHALELSDGAPSSKAASGSVGFFGRLRQLVGHAWDAVTRPFEALSDVARRIVAAVVGRFFARSVEQRKEDEDAERQKDAVRRREQMTLDRQRQRQQDLVLQVEEARSRASRGEARVP